MKIATIPFEEIMKRLSKSGHDNKCFEKLAIDHYPPEEAKLRIKKYEKSGRQQREELLEGLSRECLRRNPKYQAFENFQEIILSTVGTCDIPRKVFNEILGHVEDEKKTYQVVEKLLKRDEDFRDFEIINTSSKKSRVGVRYADFTMIKKLRLKRYEVDSIDVKVRSAAFQTFLDQAHDFSLFSDYTFLASTAGLVLHLAKKWKQRPLQAEQVFKDKCKTQRTGIKIIDITKHVLSDLAPSEKTRNLDGEIKNRALQELEIV